MSCNITTRTGQRKQLNKYWCKSEEGNCLLDIFHQTEERESFKFTRKISKRNQVGFAFLCLAVVVFSFLFFFFFFCFCFFLLISFLPESEYVVCWNVTRLLYYIIKKLTLILKFEIKELKISFTLTKYCSPQDLFSNLSSLFYLTLFFFPAIILVGWFFGFLGFMAYQPL